MLESESSQVDQYERNDSWPIRINSKKKLQKSHDFLVFLEKIKS